MSPHISLYRERFRVDGKLISEADVERLLPQISRAALTHDIPVSFFKYTIMLGLLHFAERDANVHGDELKNFLKKGYNIFLRF
tara:strand:- start:24 stop:272 length:249 start_codon:yes stop_codon:yes gene_type:complete